MQNTIITIISTQNVKTSYLVNQPRAAMQIHLNLFIKKYRNSLYELNELAELGEAHLLFNPRIPFVQIPLTTEIRNSGDIILELYETGLRPYDYKYKFL